MDFTKKRSKAKCHGGVRFDPEEGAASHVHFEETLHDSVVMVTQEEDGSFLVKVGFLKISHKYEISFTLPTTRNLGHQLRAAPIPNLHLNVVHISPCPEGHKVKCEYLAHKEGVVKEDLKLISEIANTPCVKVVLHSRILDRLHGTPMLLDGVKCIGMEPEYDSEQSDWQGFD